MKNLFVRVLFLVTAPYAVGYAAEGVNPEYTTNNTSIGRQADSPNTASGQVAAESLCDSCISQIRTPKIESNTNPSTGSAGAGTGSSQQGAR